MQQIQTIGVDLAKNVFQVHGVDESDEVVLVKQLRRNQVIPFFAKLDPCLVGMVRDSASLATRTDEAGSQCATDPTGLREGLRQTEQERCG